MIANKRLGKRGGEDLLYIIVVLFVIAIGLFVTFFITQTATTKFVATPSFNQSSEAVRTLEAATQQIYRLDYVFFAFFIGFMLALMITSWYVDTNPMFIILFFIILIIGVVLSAVLSNTWETVTQSAVFGGTVANFPITNHLMIHWPKYMAIMGLLGMVVIFGKPGGAGR